MRNKVATYASKFKSHLRTASQFYRVNCIGVGRAESHRAGFFDRAEITFSNGTRAVSGARNVKSERIEVANVKEERITDNERTEAPTSLVSVVTMPPAAGIKFFERMLRVAVSQCRSSRFLAKMGLDLDLATENSLLHRLKNE